MKTQETILAEAVALCVSKKKHKTSLLWDLVRELGEDAWDWNVCLPLPDDPLVGRYVPSEFHDKHLTLLGWSIVARNHDLVNDLARYSDKHQACGADGDITPMLLAVMTSTLGYDSLLDTLLRIHKFPIDDASIVLSIKMNRGWVLLQFLGYHPPKEVVSVLLHVAVRYDQPDMLKRLLRWGGEPYHINEDSEESLLEEAVHYGSHQCIRILSDLRDKRMHKSRGRDRSIVSKL